MTIIASDIDSLPVDKSDIRRAAGIFKVLSHPSRLTIVCHLFRKQSATQKELVEELDWPQSSVARHLGQLRERGLVEATREGNEVRLELAGEVTHNLMAAMCDWVHPETGEMFTASYRERTEGGLA